MPRRPRLQVPGAVYHVMSRGNRKGHIFDDDTDREQFLKTIADTWRRYEIRCYAACLMNNHYHLVFDTPRGNLSAAMQYLNGRFSRRSNRRHDRTGHLFEGRFRSLLVERESYLRRVARYVVLNPVRAHLVGSADAWRWSTYRATAGVEDPPDWLRLDWMLEAFRADTLEEARDRYVRYVNSPRSKRAPSSGPSAIGSRAFQQTVRDAIEARDADRLLPRGRRGLERPSLETLFAVPRLKGDERARVIYLAHATHGYRLADVSRHLRCHPSMASQALRRLALRQRWHNATTDEHV